MTDNQASLRLGRRSGMAVVYIIVVLTVLIGVVGLACDTGYVFLTAHQLQNAADSAALSGAEEVGFNTTQAVTDSVNTAAANKAAQASVQLSSASDVTIGNYNRTTGTFTANGTPTNAVKVLARRTSGSPGGAVNLFFGPIFGIKTSNVSRQAIGMTTPLSDGLIVLNKTASPAIQFTGSGNPKAKIDVTGGGVQVDSSSSTAVQWTGNPNLVASSLSVVGNNTAITTSFYPSGTLALQAPYVPDPLASLPPPPTGSVQSSTSSPLQPGWYKNGLPTGKNMVLSPGIYYIDGGISMSGNDSFTCTAGCMLYLHTGGISMGGSTSTALTPMSSGTYAGITIYEDRSNTSAISLQGGPGVATTGRLYFPSAQVTVAGNPDSTASQVICDTLIVQGSGQLNVNYNTAYDIQRHIAFLVQ